MPEVQAITGRPSFWPALAGGAAVPLVTAMTPLGAWGPWGPGVAGAALAAFGSGPVRSAGQGALIVVGATVLGQLLAGVASGGGRSQNSGEMV